MDGDTPNSNISLPRTLKVKVIANPNYWGFSGTNDDNVMVSGYAYFSNGYYDFFYGFEEDHIGCRTCGRYATEVCSKNDQRPDIAYRAVLSEDGTLINYSGSTNDNITRGGAEIFLIDRSPTETDDLPDCSSSDPEKIFKQNPDNYGAGNKILFKDGIYKNVTGAWRLKECVECYSNTGYIDSKLVVCNTGNNVPYSSSKQQIHVDNNFGTFYDPAKRYCTDYDSIEDCIQNGSMPSNYNGTLISIKRDVSTNYFMEAKVQYFSDTGNALRNGHYVALTTSGEVYDGGFYAMDVRHVGGFTYLPFVGTYSETSPIDYTGVSGDAWQVYNTIDPESCCGGAAYGVDNNTKQYADEPPYHVDIKKVFNNEKNKLYSNREKFIAGVARQDHRYIQTYSGAPYSGFAGLGDLILENDEILYPELLEGDVNYVGEHSYYGPSYEADVYDTLLRTEKDKKTTYENGTCYTKSQELMIFPDSLTQSYEYLSCKDGIQHRQNIVPRLTFVYKPCNYNDNCSFNASGQPWTAGGSDMPSTLEDLKRGFGGQEIVMHVNLGTAWGNKTRAEEPCGCGDDVPPGEIPFDPEVKVPSPIRFPCFPKFDLRPSGYGCQDPMWYNQIRQLLGISYQGQCEESYYDACWIRQPYTTYGYIRNLCGAKPNSRIDVLKSLGVKQHDASYRDTHPESGEIVEPMYVDFYRPLDDTGLGFPTDGVNSYIDILPPSTGGDDEDGDGIPDMSGVRVWRPYWGLTDNQGRLGFPYFHTKLAVGVQPDCDPLTTTYYDYVAYDARTTISGGWPTDDVPFLIEIDHEDYCVGCATNQIEDKQYYITLESLPAEYLHGTETVDADALDDTYVANRGDNKGHGFKYGFNYCKYPGLNAIPQWDQTTDVWYVPTGCGAGGYAYEPTDGSWAEANPYTGETCECLGDGVTVGLRRHPLLGTSMAKYYSTDGGVNSFTPLPTGCSLPRPGVSDIMKDYVIYFAAYLHCGYLENVVPRIDEEDVYLNPTNNRFYGSLGTLLNCGTCSHAYPATSSKPNLSLDFFYVRTGWESWFEAFDDMQLTSQGILNFLENGAMFGFGGLWNDEAAVGGLHQYAIASTSFSQGACEAGEVDVHGKCCPNPTGLICNLGVSAAWEAAVSYCTTTPDCHVYRDGTSRTIKLGTTVPGCIGSTITLWGYSYRSSQSASDATPDAGFNRGFPHGNGALGGSGCCEEGCYQGRNPRGLGTSAEGLPDFITGTTTEFEALTCGTCDGWKGGLGCVGVCAAFAICDSCYGESMTNCCSFSSDKWDENGMPINRPRWDHHCFAVGQESADEIGTFTWYPATGNCEEGYYGELNCSHAEIFIKVGSTARGLSASHITTWDGTNIPGIGNVTGIPANEPIAVRASKMNNVGTSTCAFDSGPNRETLVASEFTRPKRLSDSHGFDSTKLHMGPIECDKTLAGSVVPGTCVRPIYPNTMADIAAGAGLTTVTVAKQTCHPEIMTVHRIQCSGDGYALHVSREYYEHDRTAWATRKYTIPGPPPVFVLEKYPIYGLLDGGRDGVLYENPVGEDNPDQYFEICNTGDKDTPPNNILGTYDYPIIVPMMARSDYVSPCYEDSVGFTCVTGSEPFYKSLCTAYYDPNAYEGGGEGADGYFSTDGTGALTYTITSSGSGYFYLDENDNPVACARAIFDNPCVRINLLVDTGVFTDYAVTGYTLDYSGCGGGSGIYPTGMTYPTTIVGCNAVPVMVCDNITNDTCSVAPSAIYPNFYNGGSGTALYNYYNLTYDVGVPNAYYLTDSAVIDGVFFPGPLPGDRPRPFPTNQVSVTDSDIKTGFMNGTLISNLSPLSADDSDFTCSYSCIRDASGCGGEFFTNKEFLPRRKYLAGTKVTRYGPLSICAQTAEKGWGNWLAGHVDLSSSTINTKELGNLSDVRYLPLVDPSKEGAYTLTTRDMELADDIIYVEELTTLLGAKHPFFKMLEPQGLDTKSCIMPDSGCFDFLPIHNSSTVIGLDEQRFFSGQDVYYTNQSILREAIASGLVGASGCLLNPFKIMVDVEPCAERLSHIGTTDPMNLSWVVPEVRAGICKGWIWSHPAPCPSDGSTCDSKMYSLGYASVLGPITTKKFYTCQHDADYIDENPTVCVWETEPDCELADGESCPEQACRPLDEKEYWFFTGVDGIEYMIPYVGNARKTDDTSSVLYGSTWDSIDCSNNVTTNVGAGACITGTHTYTCDCDPKTSYSHTPKTFTPRDGQRAINNKGDGGDRALFCTIMAAARKYSDIVASGGASGCGAWGTARGYRDVTYYGNLGTDAGDAEACRLWHLIYDEYACYSPNTIIECPYPSVLKITVTEGYGM